MGAAVIGQGVRITAMEVMTITAVMAAVEAMAVTDIMEDITAGAIIVKRCKMTG